MEAVILLKYFTELETDRLRIRRLKKTDAGDMYEYACLDDVTKYLLWSPHRSLRHTQTYLSSVQKFYRDGSYFDYAVILKAENKMIGTCGFAHIFEGDNSAEIGYVINPDYQGNGYATEAVKGFISYGFRDLGLNRIEARYMVGNCASRRVMEKCGMKFEGVHRSLMLVKGEYKDIGVCAILKDEFVKAGVSIPIKVKTSPYLRF